MSLGPLITALRHALPCDKNVIWGDPNHISCYFVYFVDFVDRFLDSSESGRLNPDDDY